jgi:hypothetical protein
MPADFMANSVDDFKDLKKLENEIQLMSCPFSSGLQKPPDVLQTEFIYLKVNNGLKEKFNFLKYTFFLDIK